MSTVPRPAACGNKKKMDKYSHYTTFEVTLAAPGVLSVALNRPRKRNAQTHHMWDEMRNIFETISSDRDVRVVILSGNGKCFTAGLDVQALVQTGSAMSSGLESKNGSEPLDVARRGLRLEPFIAHPQASFTAIEKCRAPVIACIHGACIGGGIDMIAACDIRFCSSDAFFSIREVAVGLAADVGTLQRLPKTVGNDSLVRELALTARDFSAEEALQLGLVSCVVAGAGQSAVMDKSLAMAERIAARSPIAVAATKRSLVFSRDHSVADGLEHVKLLNMLNLQSDDLKKAAMSAFSKSNPTFSRL